MARAIWSGNIQLGMINIPVKLNTAVKDRTIQFRQIHSKTGNRVVQKRVDSVTGDEVDYDDIVKGYEITPGNYVTVEPAELAALEPDKSSTVDIESFVDPTTLDPMLLDHPYYLVPDKSEKAYALLREAMKRTNKAAIGRVVMRDKEYVTCIWPHGEALAMTTMHYHDEVLAPEAELDRIPVDSAQVDMAVSLVESLSEPFDSRKYADSHRESVLSLIQDKADGKQIVAPAPAPTPKPPMSDLLASLEASLALAKSKQKSKDQKVMTTT